MALVESARQRDLNKYYLPWQASRLTSVPANDVNPSDRSVRASHDTTLTALAQLAALRLRVKRCMVSLIDSTTQTILAEATQTLSLVDDRRHAPGDHLWLGNVSVPREAAMDEHVFGSRWTGQDSEGIERTFTAMVVNDTVDDDRFNTQPYVTSDPAVRFYAGVPIVTKDGHAIGVYAVSDAAPRPQGLTAEEIIFMQDVAQIVTEHLDRVKGNIDRGRGERFVRGISSFVEGLVAVKHKLDHPNDLQQIESKPSPMSRAVDPQDSDRGSVTDDDELKTDPLSETKSREVWEGSNAKPKHMRETVFTDNDETDQSAGNIRQIFDRAAKVVHKGLNAQGCVFFDAAPGLSSTASPSASHPADVVFNDNHSKFMRSEGDRKFRSSSSSSSDHNINLLSASPPPPAQHRPDDLAQILGQSLTPSAARHFRNVSLGRKQLKRCFYDYPYGKVFYLDNGNIVTSHQNASDDTITGGGGENADRPHSPASVSSIGYEYLPEELLSQMLDAKWVIFLPLFNYAQNQWFAGGFIWSNDTYISDPQGEMPYLKAFGSCIMSEVASMEALNTNIAKTRFIASISHDLRSPLHGMLGSLEFLTDTMTSAYQVSLLGSIETCGKTLLDTIDHLLDYAKINNLNRTISKNMSTQSLRTLRDTGAIDNTDTTNPLVTTFDFALLMEEVIEAVFAGQTFRKRRVRGRDAVDDAVDHINSLIIDDTMDKEEQIHAGSAKFSGKVFVILDTEKVDSWIVRSQPGACRRVIMNIFGNAIKYCNVGAIEASLSMVRESATQANVRIVVKDTGIGMSQSFLEHHLFKAFSQEDSFTAGAGLGLSIVHQIVQNLNGTVRVESEKEVGTHVSVTLPMQLAPTAASEEDDIFSAAVQITRGKRLALLVPDVDSSDIPKEQLPQGHLSRLTASIARMCKEWFDIDFIETKTIDVDTDFLMYSEPPPIEVLTTYHAERLAAKKGSREVALLIICTNAFEAAALRAAGVQHLITLGRVIEVISQPVGVRKMAKVLSQSLQRVEQLQGNADDTLTSGEGGQSPTVTEVEKRASNVKWTTSSMVYDELIDRYRPSIEAFKWKSDQPHSTTPLHTNQTNEKRPESGQIKSDALPQLAPVPSRMEVAEVEEAPHIPSVLLVDDNAINLKLLVTFMKKIKLPYVQAENGQEALQKFKDAKQPFEFVLMDLQMPVMDGLESTRRIREYEKETKAEKRATIIAITGVGDANVKAQCMDMGFNQFLTKPVKFKTLQQILEHQRNP
ncbi:hypothetical protein H2198_004737 [Neophaeococcomyces mojaviensis]|uniref:Uncharacterized protein n=1 Tax=Neophaeococcomyces mojaviensis TaxID=3383035 RepID=A0ACC3A7M4_9EURO|nr:hypothetical protein H2198_004737 [Knufia sp. JES_112]